MSNLFTEEKRKYKVLNNILDKALEECEEIFDIKVDNGTISNKRMILFLVDKLEELGYIIVKK